MASLQTFNRWQGTESASCTNVWSVGPISVCPLPCLHYCAYAVAIIHMLRSKKLNAATALLSTTTCVAIIES